MATVNNEDIIAMYGNPALIQHRMLKGLEELAGGGRVITTPNNVTAFLIEGAAVMASGMMNDIVSDLDTLYPKRIHDSAGLYKHMSDFDYLGLFSSPAMASIEMHIFRDTILKEAKDFMIVDTDGKTVLEYYKKIIIPKHTVFQIGGVPFTTLYPIEIRCKGTTDSANTTDNNPSTLLDPKDGISIVYDITEKNPLLELSNAYIEHQVYTLDSSELLVITMKIAVMQCAVKVYSEEVFQSAPFKKKFSYDDKFYAIRIFTNAIYENNDQPTQQINGVVWTELHQVLDSNIYDLNTSKVPSVVIQPDILANMVTVTVPQVFLTDKTLGTRIRVEVYTTKGEIDISLPTTDDMKVNGTFEFTGDANKDKYSHLFQQATNINIYSTESRIVGGGNGMTFEELRDSVVYSTSGGNLIVSPEELSIHFKKTGFDIHKFKDGITDRIYLCGKALTDISNKIITSGSLFTKIRSSDADVVDGVCRYSGIDDSITLLPRARYKYNDELGMCEPVNATDWAVVIDTKESQVSKNNTASFTLSPFHVNMLVVNGTPLANTYTLTKPSILGTTVTKIDDDANQVYLKSSSAKFGDDINPEDKDKFIITLNVSGSFVSESYSVSIKLRSDEGNTIVLNSYVTPSGGGSKSPDPFVFKLETNYHFNTSGSLYVKVPNGAGVGAGHIKLTSKAEVVIIGVYQNDAGAKHSVTSTYSVNIKFGERMDGIFNIVDMHATNGIPLLHPVNVPARYDKDELYRICDINPASSDITPWHSIDGGGNIVVKYKQKTNDIIYNELSVAHAEIQQNNLADYLGCLQVTFVPEYTEANAIARDIKLQPLPNDNRCRIAKRSSELTQTIIDSLLMQTPIEGCVWNLGETYDMLYPQYKYIKNTPIASFDSAGRVVPKLTAREIEYNVSMIHIGYKNTYRDRIQSVNDKGDTLSDIIAKVLGYCTEVKTSAGILFPNTDVFYHPHRSIGSALCRTNSLSNVMHPLELSLNFLIHVSAAVAGDLVTQSVIKKELIAIVNEQLTAPVFSQLNVGKLLSAKFVGSIVSIDALGINGDPLVQTLTLLEEGVSFSLNDKLTINEYGKVVTEEDITVNFVVNEV